MTYQAYALPRIQALSGHTWVAMAVVGFWWALQHSLLPFLPDWRSVLWRFLAMVPGVMALMLIYLKTRRLPPVIVAHLTTLRL
jgi:membrane protease YdiL (CAAX protease family)